tara:strand:+ start:157 stop:1437 length:1281 start_codon:yes stop_codon:yes gene_type:complete
VNVSEGNTTSLSTAIASDAQGKVACPAVAQHESSFLRDSIEQITVTDFRSYSVQRIVLDDRPVVLIGPNGAGKTNLLEAVSLLAPGRGLRGARLRELGRKGSDRPWAVAAKANGRSGKHDIGTGLRGNPYLTLHSAQKHSRDDTRDRRIIKIDGKLAKGSTDLAEILAMQWLTPKMDRLLAESSGPRRRFLDRLVFGLDPSHAKRVNEYDRALRQRTQLLRDGRLDDAWISATEEAMSASGIAIAVARLNTVNHLTNALNLSTGSFPKAIVNVSGVVEEWLEHDSTSVAAERFCSTLEKARSRDKVVGGASVGPHKSDLVVHHGEKGIEATQCSTGEQKALLISILLADARLHSSRRKSAPLLLFDELCAHLDSVRRESLFSELLGLGIQAWFTGTDRRLFEPLGTNAQWLSVIDSEIAPEKVTQQ